MASVVGGCVSVCSWRGRGGGRRSVSTRHLLRSLAVKYNNNPIQRRYSRFFFYNLLTAPRTVSNTHAQVARAQSCANHLQRIERLSRASVMLRATWYEGTAQLLSLTELKSHLFELYFVG